MLARKLGFNSINKFLNIYSVQGREGINSGEGREGENTKMNRTHDSFLLGTQHLLSLVSKTVTHYPNTRETMVDINYLYYDN